MSHGIFRFRHPFFERFRSFKFNVELDLGNSGNSGSAATVVARTTRVTMDQHRMLHGQSSNQVWRGEIMARNGHELPFHSSFFDIFMVDFKWMFIFDYFGGVALSS